MKCIKKNEEEARLVYLDLALSSSTEITYSPPANFSSFYSVCKILLCYIYDNFSLRIYFVYIGSPIF